MSDKVDFIGIGAEKSGSSWVCQCLEGHPEIGFSAQCSDRELNFFNSGKEGKGYALWPSQFDLGMAWYMSQFPKSQKVIGEFSCSYFFDEKAPERIKDAFPDVKIIATLRNPVDMIYSVYWWHKSGIRSKVPADFDQAVVNENFESIEAFRGLYHKHLSRYYKLFSKENIHVILLDDIRNEPANTARVLFEFLGVDQEFDIDGVERRINPARTVKSAGLMSFAHWINDVMGKAGLDLQKSYSRGNVLLRRLYNLYSHVNISRDDYPEMQESSRALLLDYYMDDIRALSELLGRDLSVWNN